MTETIERLPRGAALPGTSPRVAPVAESLAAREVEAAELGNLPEQTVADLRSTGVIRMLQPKTFGGAEAHPAEFAATVMDIARLNAPAGWVGGVVGIHSWEIAGFNDQLRQEIWADPETWVSSPYAPMGMLEPVDGGYRISGRVTFSSGGELCEWAILGALLPTEEGPKLRHMVLPRSDYTFDPDSWNVLGLRGTGSKDLIVDNAFVPSYRVYDPLDFERGQAFEAVGEHGPLYKLPFPVIFSAAINSASAGILENAYEKIRANFQQRVDTRGTKSTEDVYQLIQLGEAGADVRSARTTILNDMERLYDEVVANGFIAQQTRLDVRANGVRAIRRGADAIDRIFNYAGGRALQNTSPVNAALRDVKTLMAHICNSQHPIYDGWSRVSLGLDTSKLNIFA
ncbi:hypothetical protein [Granulicoccus phenolivorans]|uniref:hypothetical protein n=1 Tax=Granulicoccus phenolivorans TaxID=266854 RepID=UPI0003F5715E|nr:hypothetical protein [Granulicoccus phenolivorans]